MNTAASPAAQPPRARFRLWHGAAIFLAANALSILPAGINGDEAFYNAFSRPALAPPDWLFAPMWLFLNITSVLALGRVANEARLTPAHRRFFVLEGVSWGLFAVFNTLYFGLKSPVLGAADTVAGCLVSLASFAVVWRLNRRAALLILPRVLWLLLATYVSVWVALNNADPFLNGS